MTGSNLLSGMSGGEIQDSRELSAQAILSQNYEEINRMMLELQSNEQNREVEREHSMDMVH